MPSIEQPIEYLNNNIMGTVKILECMREYNVKKIVYSASSSCYGLAKKLPTKEIDDIDCRHHTFFQIYWRVTIKHWAEVYGINYIFEII